MYFLTKINIVMADLGNSLGGVFDKGKGMLDGTVDKVAIAIILFGLIYAMINRKAGTAIVVAVAVLYILYLIFSGGGIGLLKSFV